MSRDIYEKFCNGDRLTDKQIIQAIKDYREAQDALFKLGPCFEVSRKAISYTLIRLEEFARARNLKIN